MHMSFLHPLFLTTLAIALALYYLLPFCLQPYLLLAANVLFLLTWGMGSLCYTLLAGILGWLAGFRMEKLRRKETLGRKEKRAQMRSIMLAASAVLVLILMLTKSSVLLKLFPVNIDALQTYLAPIGISYYTLSIIGYMADVQLGRLEAERNPLRFLMFVTFFPKLLQGPIDRYKTLGPQVVQGHRFDYKQFCFGAQLMLYGMFKKLVIADRLSVFLAGVFQDPETTPGAVLLTGLFLRALHLYCDFSGYMDIAEGIAQMFGIRMAVNFNHPFFSKSAAEFWRRWHITLGAWFKDYVYLPVSAAPLTIRIAGYFRKKVSKKAGRDAAVAIPLLTVWILTGIWHGTGVNYIDWGIYWGVIILLSTIFAQTLRKMPAKLHLNPQSKGYARFQMLRTFLVFTGGRWITLDRSGYVLRRIVTNFRAGTLLDGSTLYSYGLNRQNFWMAAAGLFTVLMISRRQEQGSVREKIASYPAVLRWTIYYAAIFAVLIFGAYGKGFNAADFEYMNY